MLQTHSSPTAALPPSARASAFCNASCRQAAACEATCGGQTELLPMRGIVQRVGPFADGDRLVQPEAPHWASFAVMSGMAKTVADGKVVGFHLPGELFCLDVSRDGKHAGSVVAVGKTWFCRFPRQHTTALAAQHDAIDRHLRRLRRRERAAGRQGVEAPALERVRAFLADLMQRVERLEGHAGRIPLPMSRDDIASYLDMSAATVTRMLAKLRAEGAIAIRPDGVDVLDAQRLVG